MESANVVGYSTTTIRSGYTLLIPAFDNVGSEGLDIQKIIPDTVADGVTLQTFTDGANMDTMYYYFPNGRSGAAWYTDARGRNKAEKSFAKGEGFMTYFPSEGISLNVSGEVSLTEKTLENVRAGYTLMGNFRPVAFDIQKIIPDTVADGVTLQTFTDGANMDTMYYYFPSGRSGAAWYTDARGRNKAEKSFDPGEGFMMYLPSSINVTFQAAE